MNGHPENSIDNKFRPTGLEASQLDTFLELVQQKQATLRLLDVEVLSVEEAFDYFEAVKRELNELIGTDFINMPADLIAEKGYISDMNDEVSAVIGDPFVLNSAHTYFKGVEIIMLDDKPTVGLQFSLALPDTTEILYNVLPGDAYALAVEKDEEAEGVWHDNLMNLAAQSRDLLSSHEYRCTTEIDRYNLLMDIMEQARELFEFATTSERQSISCVCDELYRIPDHSQDTDGRKYYIRQMGNDPRDSTIPHGTRAMVVFPELATVVPTLEEPSIFKTISHNMPLLAIRNDTEDCWYWIPIEAIREIQQEIID